MAAQPLPGLHSHAGFRKGYPPSLTCLLYCWHVVSPLLLLLLCHSIFLSFSSENSCFPPGIFNFEIATNQPPPPPPRAPAHHSPILTCQKTRKPFRTFLFPSSFQLLYTSSLHNTSLLFTSSPFLFSWFSPPPLITPSSKENLRSYPCVATQPVPTWLHTVHSPCLGCTAMQASGRAKHNGSYLQSLI
jgi:hypothetical protein